MRCDSTRPFANARSGCKPVSRHHRHSGPVTRTASLRRLCVSGSRGPIPDAPATHYPSGGLLSTNAGLCPSSPFRRDTGSFESVSGIVAASPCRILCSRVPAPRSCINPIRRYRIARSGVPGWRDTAGLSAAELSNPATAVTGRRAVHQVGRPFDGHQYRTAGHVGEIRRNHERASRIGGPGGLKVESLSPGRSSVQGTLLYCWESVLEYTPFTRSSSSIRARMLRGCQFHRVSRRLSAPQCVEHPFEAGHPAGARYV